jgi:pectate lyase
MRASTPSDLLSFLQARALPRRLLRVGLALTSTVYTLRPDLLLAKSALDAGTSSPSNDWLGESGMIPFVPPAARFHSRGELFFIDAGVADSEAFWLAVPKNATVLSIPSGVDSWAFMAQEAEKFRGLAAVHLVSHGEHGALVLNGRRYAAADLAPHIAELRQLGRALTKNGDIFLYGCEAGAGREGQALLDTIARATGADVAASSGDIGSKAKGGHWDLEVTTGPVDRSLMLDAKVMADYDYVLFSTTVTTLSALDSAIGTANADSSNDTITVNGEIDATSSTAITTINKTTGTLSIVGGTGGILSGANFARVINVTKGSVAISNLTISNGFVTGAGGNVSGNAAGGPGGDALGANILNAGTLTISNCTITGGKAAGGGGGGGGYDGGGGGGGGGFGTTFGGVGGANFGHPGGAASAGAGGQGYGYSPITGGAGGTTSGGAGGTYGAGYTNGGNGGTANNGTIAIGGGGGGSGFAYAGGRGGNAAGGIYNTGFLTITGSSITNNIGAGGGGGGGASSIGPGSGNGGTGGSGVGGIWNARGTLQIDSSTNSSLSTGHNVGGAGAGGQATGGGSSSGATGTATSTVSTTCGGLTVTNYDAPPVVTTSGGSAAFVAGDNTTSTPVVIDGGILVSDLDNTTLASATVTITGNFHRSEDVLAFSNNSSTMCDISASYNSGTGTLTLTSAGAIGAMGTLAQWQAALRSVTYTDTAVTPDNATRTISFVVNDGTVNSNTATRNVTVADTDQTPIVTTSSGTTAFVEVPGISPTPVVIDGGILVSDLDNTTLASATVTITGNFHRSEDVLAFSNNSSTMCDISASYNSGTGTLTLTSAGAMGTLAQWQAALRSVTYTNGSATPNTATRTISFVVNDGAENSAAGTKTVSITAASASYAVPAPDGFAASATGGAVTGSQSVTVLTAANFRTQAQSSTPCIITVAGLLNLGATSVNVNSNKTIQGADANAGLVGNLTLASGVSNVIIRGLNLANPGTNMVNGAYTDGGDGLTITGASNVFITHCTFFDTANHAIEITNGADNLTVSWCEFYYTAGQTVHRDSMLIGAPGGETAPLHVTLHHNFWSTNVDQQMPVATFGYVHLYSNYFNAVGNTSGTVSSDQAQLLSELNVYTGMANPLTVQNVSTSLPIGRILALGNSYTATTGTAPYSGTDQVFTPSYSYEALPVSDVAAVVSANAGNIAGAGYTDAAVGTASITGPSGAVTPATAFTLTAVPASFTPATYQWRLANLDIAGATSSTYTVSNTQAGNAGIYTVAIGLASGDVVVSTPFTVTLGASPSAAVSPAPVPHSGGGAMSEWFLGALAMLATLRKMRQRRRARS